jgi:FtsP/CotA-like multicopper oxidase with cupredoxin domain
MAVNQDKLYSRRAVLAGGAGLAMVPFLPRPGFGATRRLQIVSRILDVKGKPAQVYGIMDQHGKSGLEMSYDELFSVTLENHLAEDSLVHWHGLTPPVQFDGTPMLSGPALRPGESKAYEFSNSRVGTHWMHSHLGLQSQKLLAAPLIVRETGVPLVDEQEHVVLIHDFTFRDPAEILAELQGGGGGHGGHDMAKMDESAIAQPAMANDVVFDAILANDRTLDDPEIVQAEKAGRFRLRLINASAATNLWIELGEIEGELIAVDGNAVYPVKAKRFALAVAQRADIRLSLPPGAGAFPIIFQAEGAALRGGIILRAGAGAVGKLSDQGEAGALLDFSLERTLKSVAVLRDEPVSRVEVLTLTGGGTDYVWGLNGKTSMHDVLFNVRDGERMDVVIHNVTAMAHPMHLHGHYFKVVGLDGTVIDGALRDTIHVPAGSRATIRFDADNPGSWAFHCHHLYHQNSGMMGAIAYVGSA